LTESAPIPASNGKRGSLAGHLPSVCSVGIATVAGLAAAANAGAQAPARDTYLGVGIASFDYGIDVGDVEFIDTSTASFKVYGGFRLGHHWSFEAAFQTTATDEHSGALGGLPLGAPTGAGPVTAAVRLELMTLRALRLHRYRWGSIYAAVGVSGAAVDTEIAGAATQGIGVSLHTSKNGLTVGAGVQWDLAGPSLRLAYDRWDADMGAVELALHWRI